MTSPVRIADLSEAEITALGLVRAEVLGEATGVVYIRPDGIPLTEASRVQPLAVIHDERIIQLGDGMPMLPAVQHKSAQLWQPKWLTVRARSDGLIETVVLGGPVMRLDGEQYADGRWEHLHWFGRRSHPMQKLWPEGAPPYVVAALRWLIDNDNRLRLPAQD